MCANLVQRTLKEVQRLYHLVGNPNLKAHDKNEFQCVNYEGTCTLFKEAVKQNIKVVFYTSTESILTGARLVRHPMFFNNEKAVNELGFPQRLLRQALIDEMECLVNEGLVMRSISSNGYFASK